MIRWAPVVVNVVLFDALWTLAVFGAGEPWWWAAPALIVVSAAAQLRWSPSPAAEAALILVGAVFGLALDLASKSLGLFQYASPSQAEFILVFTSLWINFGTTLRPSLRWMWRRPALGAVLGAVGGPLAYRIAAGLGAIAPIEPMWRALVWCGVQYALAVPLWCAAAALVLSHGPGSSRPPIPSGPPQRPGTQAS